MSSIQGCCSVVAKKARFLSWQPQAIRIAWTVGPAREASHSTSSAAMETGRDVLGEPQLADSSRRHSRNFSESYPICSSGVTRAVSFNLHAVTLVRFLNVMRLAVERERELSTPPTAIGLSSWCAHSCTSTCHQLVPRWNPTWNVSRIYQHHSESCRHVGTFNNQDGADTRKWG